MELSPRLKYIQGQDGLVIVKFPKPTLLYSLKEKEGFRLYMHDYQLVSYLQNLIQKSIPLDPIPVERIISDATERDRRFTKVCPFLHPHLFFFFLSRTQSIILFFSPVFSRVVRLFPPLFAVADEEIARICVGTLGLLHSRSHRGRQESCRQCHKASFVFLFFFSYILKNNKNNKGGSD